MLVLDGKSAITWGVLGIITLLLPFRTTFWVTLWLAFLGMKYDTMKPTYNPIWVPQHFGTLSFEIFIAPTFEFHVLPNGSILLVSYMKLNPNVRFESLQSCIANDSKKNKFSQYFSQKMSYIANSVINIHFTSYVNSQCSDHFSDR